MSGPEGALAAIRFLHDGATALLWGAFATLAFLVPRGLVGDIALRLNAFRISAVAVAVATTAAALPIDAAAIGDGWPEAIDPATVGAVLFETSVGAAWMVQATTALLLVATLRVARRRQPTATAVAAALLLATLAFNGHAAMHEGWLGILHQGNHVVHVLAGGAWLGALLPLLPLLRALDDPARRGDAGTAVRRFSAAGHGAVALVIATGVLNTMLILGRLPTDLSSPYQALLAVKIALVLGMMALALANRYVLVPRMGEFRGAAVRILRLTTTAEIGLGLLVIACVGVFGLLEPV